MLRKLYRQGFVIYEKYGGVTLTSREKVMAEAAGYGTGEGTEVR
jgi:Mn-dependent DtxR family transcriptional regulator